MCRPRWAAGLAALAVVLAGCTVRVSVSSSGGDPDSSSGSATISADGRFVAFVSLASNLVAGDNNHLQDVYLRDVKHAATTRVSVDKNGGDPDFDSFSPSINADGGRVAFTSLASDLVDGDTSATPDVFVREAPNRSTTRVSVNMTGGNPNGFSGNPDIIGNGRFVAFDSFASDLVAGDGNGTSDVFVRDLRKGATTRVSVDASGGDSNGPSVNPSISAHGRYVAFTSSATDLVNGDGNSKTDIFVRHLVAGTTTRVSVDTAGGDSNGTSAQPSISADGKRVAFISQGSNLVANDGNVMCGLEEGPCFDVFVRDLDARTTVRASVDTNDQDPNETSFEPSISGDGQRVAFASPASNLVPNDRNQAADIFVRDLPRAKTIRVSVDRAGGDANSGSRNPSLAADGRVVAFESFATDLVSGSDKNSTTDVFQMALPR